jgi:hypothetical protein
MGVKNENVTNLFQLAKKVTNLFQIANKSDELIPNGSVEPVPIDKSCRLYSIWRTFDLIPNGRVGLVQPPLSLGNLDVSITVETLRSSREA